MKKRKNLFELTDQKWSGDEPQTKRNFWTYFTILKAVPGTFWDWAEKLKKKKYFQRLFDIPLAQYFITKEFLKCMHWLYFYLFTKVRVSTVDWCFKKNFSYKNFMVTFYGWDSRLQNHYKETVYFLSPSIQEYLVLISSISKGWKVESTLNNAKLNFTIFWALYFWKY